MTCTRACHASRCYFFFFQAEDGIRDLYVTGVQTCALPISERRGFTIRRAQSAAQALEQAHVAPPDLVVLDESLTRSEERRVGKEWRLQWSQQRASKSLGQVDQRR